MTAYDSSNLKSTLAYIKDRFGLDVFTKPGRVPALLSDLAPSLKNDRIMLERLSRLGILDDFVENTYENDAVQKRIVSKSMTQLTQSEFIRPAIAASYISVMTEVFGWKIEVEIPKETTEEKMKFDSQRYLRESQERNYSLAVKAYISENTQDALLLFSKSYGQGNILAGIKLGQMHWYGECTGEKEYEVALKYFIEAKAYNYPLAAEWVVEAYRMGHGVPKDKDKAAEISESCRDALIEMCTCGDPDAQYMYGFYLLYGILCVKNEEQGFFWMNRAATGGHLIAKVEVADCYISGRGCVQDVERGVSSMKELALTKSIKAHYRLGEMYLYGEHVEKDYAKALKLLLFSGERGHRNSQRYIGDIYYYGYGVEKDLEKARDWYLKSAELGNTVAMSQLGDIFFYGEGIEKDIDRAFYYHKRAADAGRAYDQFMMRYFFFYEAFKKYNDYTKGKEYLEKAAEQGFAPAQRELARNYVTGQFGFQDDKKFIYWINEAAKRGDTEAQRILGEAYMHFGDESTFPVSYPDAIQWLEKAFDGRDVKAAVLLAEVYSQVDEYKNKSKFIYYTEQAERLMTEKEKTESTFGVEHESLADLLYKYSEEQGLRQKSFDHYCRAFMAGRQSALYDLGWMYFVNGYTNDFFKLSPDELLQKIIEAEEDSKSSSLAYLLGLVYFNGYKIHENKAAAEQWYLKAIDKGSLTAACKLALYYVNERKLYDKGYSVLEKAHEDGSVEATRLLGLCYKNGIGVKKNRSKAKALLKEAADKGDEDAVAELKKFIF